MYLNPDRMTATQRSHVARWLQANGCRDYAALTPMVLKGKILHYDSLGRRDAKSLARLRLVPGSLEIETKPKRLRIRIPLGAVA